MSIHKIHLAIQDYINVVQTNLKQHGVSEEVIEKCFNTSTDKKYTRTHDKVILIKNYSSKSHALFGIPDINNRFKDKYLSKHGLFNNKLRYGKGWVLKSSENVEKQLRNYNIEFEKYNDDEYKKMLDSMDEHVESDITEEENEKVVYNFLGNSNEVSNENVEESKEEESDDDEESKEEESDDDEESKEEESDDDEESKEEEIPVPDKLKAKRNKWNNLQDDNGYVFKKLSIGSKGEMGVVVIGKQDEEADENKKNLASILKLSESESSVCEDNKIKYLSKPIMLRLKKNLTEQNKTNEFKLLLSIFKQ